MKMLKTKINEQNGLKSAFGVLNPFKRESQGEKISKHKIVQIGFFIYVNRCENTLNSNYTTTPKKQTLRT